MNLEQALQYDLDGRYDYALDIIFDELDELLLTDNFAEVDIILDSLDVSEWSTECLLGFLTVSNWGKKHLKNRDNFFLRVVAVLEWRGDTETSILLGLQ